MNNEIDPTKPVMMTAFPQAQCRVLDMIDALFPLVVAVREYPDTRETLYKVDPADGVGISAFFREEDAPKGIFQFMNRE